MDTTERGDRMFSKRHETDRDERTERARAAPDEAVPGRGADRARGLTRALATLIGAAVAGFLVWLATQAAGDSTGEYWAAMGLLAAAGLALALSQLLGGWTKWGWPRISAAVFLLGFLPALVVGGWVLLAHQPNDEWFRGDVLGWSNDIRASGLVDDLGAFLPVIPFALGLLFGFTFDTTGPRVDERTVVEDRYTRTRPVPAEEHHVADEPLTAERRTVAETTPDPDAEHAGRRRLFGRREATTDGDTTVAERPPRPPE
jgi:hypothetical protein